MPITQFTDGVEVNGSQDIPQLKVKGHTTQSEPLQTWADGSATELAQISEDGRVIVGDDLGEATPDALIEAHRSDSSSRPQRAFHALGQVAGVLTSTVQWIVQELEILGTGAVGGLHSTLRIRIRNATTGDTSQAELVAGDVEAVNEAGTSTTPLGQITGLKSTISNGDNGYIEQATGLDIAVHNSNPDGQNSPINTAYGVRVNDLDQATTNYAIHTGSGIVHHEDTIELKAPLSVPGTPPASIVRIYAKADGKLYAKTDTGAEFLVSLAPTPQAGDEVKFLRGDGTWQDAGNSGGTITSVGLSAPSDLLSVTNSPITESGTIQLDKVSQNPNLFYASPPSGASAAPTFRSLASADFPNSVVQMNALADGAVSRTKMASDVMSTNRVIGYDAITGAVTTFPQGSMVYLSGMRFTTNKQSITISSIPSTYKHLRLYLMLRSNRSNQEHDKLIMRFNNNQNSSYACYSRTFSDSADRTSQLNDHTEFDLHSIGGDTGIMAKLVIDIFDYAEEGGKNISFTGEVYESAIGTRIVIGAGTWKIGNQPITSIYLAPKYGDWFVSDKAGYSLWGIKE